MRQVIDNVSRSDPAPSRLAYRIERLMLTPGFRLLLRAGLPMAVTFVAGVWYLSDEARRDAAFHLSILEASHNVVLLHMMRSMFDMLREGVFYNRQKMFQQQTTRASLLDQHRAINDALQARRPEAARAAVEAHLSFVERALRDQQLADRNAHIARQRLDHDGGL